jgi:hypothetical protein
MWVSARLGGNSELRTAGLGSNPRSELDATAVMQAAQDRRFNPVFNSAQLPFNPAEAYTQPALNVSRTNPRRPNF